MVAVTDLEMPLPLALVWTTVHVCWRDSWLTCRCWWKRASFLAVVAGFVGGKWTMANIARPPCDEAAILAGSCQRRATTNGGWILAATILGSSMAFIDGTVVNVALPALQTALHATLADVQWVV